MSSKCFFMYLPDVVAFSVNFMSKIGNSLTPDFTLCIISFRTGQFLYFKHLAVAEIWLGESSAFLTVPYLRGGCLQLHPALSRVKMVPSKLPNIQSYWPLAILMPNTNTDTSV